MKTSLITLLIAGLIIWAACKKNDSTGMSDTYSSMQDFYARNEAPTQLFTVDAAAGGRFTATQGTRVTIPPGAFGPVTGEVQITFREVYKKSDMILSRMSTTLYGYYPLKSAGMFVIKASLNNVLIQLAPSKCITIEQPFNGLKGDSLMKPFVVNFGEGEYLGPGLFWTDEKDTLQQMTDSLKMSASDYVFSLYRFESPLDSATWCNSDNKDYFSSYTPTDLTLHPTDNPDTFQTDVFLIFKNVNCMIHVYKEYRTNDFPYSYAPQGLQCTVVAVGEKGGKLFSSFVPITIGNNQTVNFTLTETSTTDFKSKLKALD